MNTLLEKFNLKVAQIDRQPTVVRYDPPVEAEKPVKLYNIFKRSLPVGYNKLAFQNVTEEDVAFLFRNVLISKTKQDDSVVYWDAVEVGETDIWNVFSNEGIRDSKPNINTYREAPARDVEWKD